MFISNFLLVFKVEVNSIKQISEDSYLSEKYRADGRSATSHSPVRAS